MTEHISSDGDPFEAVTRELAEAKGLDPDQTVTDARILMEKLQSDGYIEILENPEQQP